MGANKETIMFRVVPTMRCNFRCEYCFIEADTKKSAPTMFDEHSVEEWIDGIDAFSDYNIELYFWGGEPFCIDDTYTLLREWLKRENVISGIRVDTNIFFADKIVERCPSSKLKMNCSYHMQYHSLEEEFRKVKILQEHEMVGMVNFVASKYNLEHLRTDYNMTVLDLINKFEDIGVFLNVAGDFAYANNPSYEKYDEYKAFIMQFVSPEDWEYLRGKNEMRLCSAGKYMYTVQHNGDFTTCLDDKIRGNFFEGRLERDKTEAICKKQCPSLVSYPFHCDNSFPRINSMLEYVERCKSHRASVKGDYIDFKF